MKIISTHMYHICLWPSNCLDNPICVLGGEYTIFESLRMALALINTPLPPIGGCRMFKQPWPGVS